MVPISKSEERKLLSKNDSFFFGDNDYLARFERNGKQVVYQSDCEVICLSEFFIDEFRPGAHFVLFFKLPDERYYSSAVKNNVVIREKTGSLDEIKLTHEFDINESQNIIANFDVSFEGVTAKNIGEVDLTVIPTKYTTSLDEANRRRLKKRVVRWVGVLLAVLTIGNYLFQGAGEGGKQDRVRIVDIYDSYKADVSNQIGAYQALVQATYLYALSLSFPEHMQVEEIRKVGTAIELRLKKTQLRLSEVHLWLESNPQMKPFYKQNKFVVDLSDAQTVWSQLIVPIGDFPVYLHDKAIEMGGVEIELFSPSANDHYTQQTLKVRFSNKEIGLLALFADLLEETPSFLSTLSITPSDGKSSKTNVQLEITVKGMANEQENNS